MLDTVALVDRAPEALRRFVYRIAAGQGALGRIADTVRFRYSEDEVPSPPIAGSAPIRLTIGPANSAGQGFRWARAIEESFPEVVAQAMRGVGPDPFTAEVDLLVPVAVYQRSTWWNDAFERFLAAQSHVIWESGLPLLGRRYGSDVRKEMSVLRDSGVREALMFHGSDIRPPARHAHNNRWSPFGERSGRVRALEEVTVANAALAAEFSGPVFVSTPDLLQWLPDAMWCPVVIDPSRWSDAAPVRKRADRPVVVHAPSHSWLKGTELVEPLLQRLSGEGLIEYRQITGVPHAAMPSFYADADIVLDQFVLGIYGVAACEAMASGRLVMSHVDGFTRTEVLRRTGLELPVHEVTIESLETELRRAVADPDAFESVRQAGPEFVATVHDGRRSAEAMAPFLGLTE